MQRHDMIAVMGGLGLKGMAGAFDDAITIGLQRNRTAMEILTDLLRTEIAHRHAASIRYRMSAAKLPTVKDIDTFAFDGTPINEGLVRSLHSGSFLRGGVTLSWSAAPARARPILPPRSPPMLSATARVAATSTPSIWSPGLRKKSASAKPARLPPSSLASISSCSMNSAICPSPDQAANCCSISSANSTNGHQ